MARSEFVVPLVKAMQEQQEIIEGQETKINGQQATITELKTTIDQQKNDYLLLLRRIEALEK